MKRLGVLAFMALSFSTVARAEEYSVWSAENRAPEYGTTREHGTLPSPAPLASDEEAADPEDLYYDGYYDGYAAALSADLYDDGYDPQAYEEFEDELAPYGSWVDVPSYGHVWAPSVSVVGSDFNPYVTGGHFTYTDYGWTWISVYDWGWAPFHYGRWVDLVSYGWCWVPGTIWGPAWVDWRSGGGYVGWAPLPPRGVVVGPPTVRRGASGVVVGAPSGTRPGGITVGPPPSARSPKWSFVLEHQMGSPKPSFVASHVVPRILPRTTVVNQPRSITTGGAAVRFNGGPVISGFGGSSTVTLQSIAPRVMPRAAIAPRVGAPLATRPWAREPSRVNPPRSIPLGAPNTVPQGPPRSIPIGPPRYVPSGETSMRPVPNYVAPQQIRPLGREPIFSVTRSDGTPAGLPSVRSIAPSPVAPSWQPAPRSPAFTPRYSNPYSPPPYNHSYSPPSHSFSQSAPSFGHSYSPPSRSFAPAYQPPATHFSAPAPRMAPTPSAVRPSFGPTHPGATGGMGFRGRVR